MSTNLAYIGVDGGLATQTQTSGGTLASVGLTMPPPFIVSGSPLTSDGVLDVTLPLVAASMVWASPAGGAGAVSFRLLEAADIPPLDASKIASGLISPARLGSGVANGSTFLRGDGTWAAVAVVPGGPTSAVQFNDGGSFGGSLDMTYNPATKLLVLATSLSSSALQVNATGSGSTGISITRSSGSAPGLVVAGPAQGNSGLVIVNVTSGIVAAYLGYTGGQGQAGVLGMAGNASTQGVIAATVASEISTVQYPLAIKHDTSAPGSMTSGFGAGIVVRLRTSGGTNDAGRYAVAWSTATEAARSSYHTWETVFNAGAMTERMRLTADGTLRVGTGGVFFGLRPAATGTPVWTMPSADGGGGDVLTTSGSGTLSWTPGGGGGYVDPLTSDGDLLVRASGVTTRLPVGTSGQILSVQAGLPAWQTLALYSDPTTTAGDLVIRDAANVLTRLPLGTPGQVLTVVAGAPAWQSGASGYADPLTTAGDLLVRASGVTTRLPVGTGGQVLTVVAGAPAWQTLALYGDPTTTAGDLVIRDASNVLTRLPLGTGGQVLTVVAGQPAWQAGASGYVDPLTTDGDLLVRASGVTTRLPVGTAGQVLTVVAGAPAWQTMAFYADPTTTAGDLVIRDASNILSRLPVGAGGHVLTVVGGVPTWQAVPSAYTDPLTTDGDLLVRTSGMTTRLPVGTSGQVLRVTAGLPAWQTLSLYADPTTTAGDMVIRDSSNVLTRLPIGTSGQVLTVASGAPAWSASPGLTIGSTTISGGGSRRLLFEDSTLQSDSTLTFSVTNGLTHINATSGRRLFWFYNSNAGGLPGLIESSVAYNTPPGASVGGLLKIVTPGGSGARQAGLVLTTGTTVLNVGAGPSIMFGGTFTSTEATWGYLGITRLSGTNSGWELTGVVNATVSQPQMGYSPIDGTSWYYYPSNTGVTFDATAIYGNPLTPPSGGFGASSAFFLRTSTTPGQLAGRLSVLWTDATHVARTSRFTLALVDNTVSTEVLRADANGVLDLRPPTSELRIDGVRVLGVRISGWQDPSGTLSRSTFNTNTVSTADLAARVGQLIADLKSHGLIGT